MVPGPLGGAGPVLNEVIGVPTGRKPSTLHGRALRVLVFPAVAGLESSTLLDDKPPSSLSVEGGWAAPGTAIPH